MLFASTAKAVPIDGSMSFGNAVSLHGTGIGAVTTLMSLQTANGQTTTEWGSVFWNGTSDATTGDVSKAGNSQFNTVSIATLNGLGVGPTNLGVVFQVNQVQAAGQDTLNLHTFQLDLYDASGNHLAKAVFNQSAGGDTAALTGTGVGTSGWLFEASGISSWFDPAHTDYRVGISVPGTNPITNANDGPDTFFLANTSAP
jgi:hypothetical protein